MDQTLFKKNINNGFKIIKIWRFNPKAMDGKTKPFKVYILDATNILDGDNDDFDGLDNEQTGTQGKWSYHTTGKPNSNNKRG